MRRAVIIAPVIAASRLASWKAFFLSIRLVDVVFSLAIISSPATLRSLVWVVIKSNVAVVKSLLLMEICLSRVVGNRPDRYEPRILKRWAKPYELMQKPRSDY